jgi:hypothetical protein
VDDAAHDCLGKNVKQVRSHGQDALDAGAHQGRCDDKPAAGADAPGDQAGAQSDENGNDENPIGIKGRTISFLAA